MTNQVCDGEGPITILTRHRLGSVMYVAMTTAEYTAMEQAGRLTDAFSWDAAASRLAFGFVPCAGLLDLIHALVDVLVGTQDTEIEQTPSTEQVH
jgi:hypothetical protein